MDGRGEVSDGRVSCCSVTPSAFLIRTPHSPGRGFCINFATLCSSLEDRHTTIVGASFARSVAALFPLVAEQLATLPSWRHHGRTTWRSREFDLAAVSTYMDHYVHRSSPDQQDWSAVVKDCQCPTNRNGHFYYQSNWEGEADISITWFIPWLRLSNNHSAAGPPDVHPVGRPYYDSGRSEWQVATSSTVTAPPPSPAPHMKSSSSITRWRL
jgi:hypothetical protein